MCKLNDPSKDGRRGECALLSGNRGEAAVTWSCTPPRHCHSRTQPAATREVMRDANRNQHKQRFFFFFRDKNRDSPKRQMEMSVRMLLLSLRNETMELITYAIMYCYRNVYKRLEDCNIVNKKRRGGRLQIKSTLCCFHVVFSNTSNSFV